MELHGRNLSGQERVGPLGVLERPIVHGSTPAWLRPGCLLRRLIAASSTKKGLAPLAGPLTLPLSIRTHCPRNVPQVSDKSDLSSSCVVSLAGCPVPSFSLLGTQLP